MAKKKSKPKITKRADGKPITGKEHWGYKELIPKPPDFVPTNEFPEGHRLHGTKHTRCKAWSPRNGRQCLNIAVKGMEVCRFHGGSSPRGAAHPRYKGKGYSRYMPVRLTDLVEQVEKTEARLLENWDEIIMLRARLMDVLQRVDSHEAGYWWKEARKAYKKFSRAMRSPAPTESEKVRQARIMEEALADLEEALNAGNADYAAWEEVYKVVGRLTRVQEQQVKTLVAKDNVITNQQLIAILDTIITTIKTEVPDERTKNRIVAGIVAKFQPPTA